VRASKRFVVLVPVISIVSALALSAQAEEPRKPEPKGGPARPGGPAMHPGAPHMGPGGPHMAHGPLPMRNFGGHAFHGHLAWGGGRWRHEVRNGRDGWWWDVGGAWYFYPQRLDGPPTYISDVEYADDAYADEGPPDAGGPPPGAGYPPPPAVAAYPPPPPPPPPDAAAGAVGGAVIGGILGGVLTGRPGGAIAGAAVGATTGALVGAQAAARPGYYLAQGGCYYRYPSGQYVVVDPRYCN
jgi:hypothetical protein